MAASGVQLNWTGVGFTPNSGSLQTITRVTSLAFKNGTKLIKFTGDNNRYPVLIANQVNEPSADLTSADAATLFGIGPGVAGTLVAEQLDFLGATGGAINWTMANAVRGEWTDTGRWGSAADGTVTFEAYSTDGSTDPLAVTSRA